MILFVRKYFHKKIMQGLIIVMTISLVGIGSFSPLINLFFADSNAVFSVDGRSVTRAVFALRVSIEKRIIDFYNEQLGALAPRFLAQVGLSMNPEQNAYNKLTQELVLSSCIDRSGLVISTQELIKKIQDPGAVINIIGAALPRVLYDRNGKLQHEILVQLLSSLGLTIQDFEKLLEDSAKRDLAINLFHMAIPVTKKELDMYALKEFGKRTFNLVTYTLDGYLKQARKETPTPEELQEFFTQKNAQSHAYWTPEKRSGIIWRVQTDTKNKEAMTQAAQEALKGSAEDFEKFIAKHHGKKTIVKEVEKSPKNTHLFQVEIDNKGLFHDGSDIIIALATAVQESTEKPYAAVEKEVLQDYYRNKAQKAMIEDLEGVGVSDEHIVTTEKFTLTPETTERELERLNKESFSGDRVKNMVVDGSRLRGLRDQGGYVITLEHGEMGQSLTPEQYMAARKVLLNENERIVTAASVDSLMKHGKIKKNTLSGVA